MKYTSQTHKFMAQKGAVTHTWLSTSSENKLSLFWHALMNSEIVNSLDIYRFSRTSTLTRAYCLMADQGKPFIVGFYLQAYNVLAQQDFYEIKEKNNDNFQCLWQKHFIHVNYMQWFSVK